ncbi:MAG: DUF5320 domain-containing protein [Bacilli bacterium]
MPRRDGTGPMGQGSMTGRGLGNCTGVNRPFMGSGYGRGNGRGYGINYVNDQMSYKSTKEQLQDEKSYLESRLEEVKKQLDTK